MAIDYSGQCRASRQDKREEHLFFSRAKELQRAAKPLKLFSEALQCNKPGSNAPALTCIALKIAHLKLEKIMAGFNSEWSSMKNRCRLDFPKL
jgi:hypothetical protein